MPTYTPPLRDMQFVLHEVLDVVDELKALPAHADVDADTIDAVLEEGGKFAREVLAPLNAGGDAEGCVLDKATHEVKTATGFKAAYAQYVEGGWPALSCDPAFGGQGLPHVVNQCLYEMLNSANQAWTMYPGLSHGAYEACTRTAPTSRSALPAQAHERPLDRHDVPDRAAVRHRSRPAAHQGRAAGRRHLQAHRQQDLHLGRRARHGREHHPPRAGAPARCADRLQGHLAVRRAEVQREAPTARSASATRI